MAFFNLSLRKAPSANHSSISTGSRVSIKAVVGTAQPEARIVLMLCWYRQIRSSCEARDRAAKAYHSAIWVLAFSPCGSAGAFTFRYTAHMYSLQGE